MKSKSFTDFSILLLKGELKLLTFGKYCALTANSSECKAYKRRRVIKHFYDRIMN